MAKWNVLPCSGTTVEFVQTPGHWSPYDTTAVSEIIAIARTSLSASEFKTGFQLPHLSKKPTPLRVERPKRRIRWIVIRFCLYMPRVTSSESLRYGVRSGRTTMGPTWDTALTSILADLGVSNKIASVEANFVVTLEPRI